MQKYKLASILMIIHGAFMEIGGCLFLIPVLVMGTDKYDVGQYFSFIVPYFQENLYLMMIAGMIYGIDNVYASSGNYGWNIILQCISSYFGTIFWK